jgi:DNA-binding MarR family transcriptional regulator
LERSCCTDDRRKVEYRLTPKGEALLPTLIALRQWGERWGDGGPANPVLVDARDRRPVGEIAVMAADGRKLTLEELCWVDRSQL